MPEKHPKLLSTHKEPVRKRMRHAGEVAVHRLHELEHKAADAYHTIEEHSPRELLQDIQALLARFSAWLLPHIEQFKSWYLDHSTLMRVVYGLTLVPVVAVFGFLGIMLVKFGGPVLLVSVLLLKFVMLASKMLFFIGYIGYKIVKTLLMWYITISRLYLGDKAKRVRQACALQCDFNVKPASDKHYLSYQCQRKTLVITHRQQGQLIVLFSYLRYAIRGQRELLRHLRRRWTHYLTPWRQTSLDLIKQELAPVGISMFSPHQLGAGLEGDRILVPGDAALELIEFNAAGEVWLHFLIRWVEWHFAWRKTLPFVAIRREHKQASWHVEARFQALSAESIGAK